MNILLWDRTPLTAEWLKQNRNSSVLMCRAYWHCSGELLVKAKNLVDNCRTNPDDHRSPIEFPKLLKLFAPYLDEVVEPIKAFTPSEQGAILELACLALSDADTFDHFVEKHDLSDAEVKALQEKLEKATS
jgi:hypothetical protein